MRSETSRNGRIRIWETSRTGPSRARPRKRAVATSIVRRVVRKAPSGERPTYSAKRTPPPAQRGRSRRSAPPHNRREFANLRTAPSSSSRRPGVECRVKGSHDVPRQPSEMLNSKSATIRAVAPEDVRRSAAASRLRGSPAGRAIPPPPTPGYASTRRAEGAPPPRQVPESRRRQRPWFGR